MDYCFALLKDLRPTPSDDCLNLTVILTISNNPHPELIYHEYFLLGFVSSAMTKYYLISISVVCFDCLVVKLIQCPSDMEASQSSTTSILFVHRQIPS